MSKIKKDALIFVMVAAVIIIAAGIVLYLNHFYGFFIFSSPRFSRTYVSLRFDDGLISQKQAFALIDKYNMAASVYVITSKLNSTSLDDRAYYMNWTDLDKVKNFIRIGSHTVNHLDLTRTEDYKSEIIDSKKILEEHGFNATVFVYPGGNYDDKVLAEVEKDYDCAATQDVGTNYLPIQPYLLKDFTVRSYNSLDTIKRVIKPGKWNILTFHDVGNFSSNLTSAYKDVADNNDISLEFFESILKYIQEQNYKVITIEAGCAKFKNETS